MILLRIVTGYVYLLRRSGRPVFEPPAVVINPSIAIDYSLGWCLVISFT